MPYYDVLFNLLAAVAAVARQNKAVVYDLLFRTAADTLLIIAADPKHLGAKIGLTAVLHTWGSAMTHYLHVHIVVPGGGLSPDGARWIACRPGFFLPVRVLSRLFRLLFLDRMAEAHRARRLLALDERGVTFRWKDYRARNGAKGNEWIKTMTLPADEFLRRFLLHVLPDGFHRIRHYGLFASATRAANIARIRSLTHPSPPREAAPEPEPTAIVDPPAGRACPCCGGRMLIVERFRRGEVPRLRPSAVGFDTS